MGVFSDIHILKDNFLLALLIYIRIYFIFLIPDIQTMKRRRERAICLDKVSRVMFPSTFILLNIIYWLVFNDSKQTFF